jgi:hypothetical protein
MSFNAVNTEATLVRSLGVLAGDWPSGIHLERWREWVLVVLQCTFSLKLSSAGWHHTLTVVNDACGDL